MNDKRFINDVLKPWDELNNLLCQNLALQVDLSDITRLAGSVAVSIRHQPELIRAMGKEADPQPIEQTVLKNAGDYWKHGPLDKPQRNCPIYTASLFEYDDQLGFRFIRNVVFMEHQTLGYFDFLETAATAAKFWIGQYDIQINWPGLVKESDAEFEPTARLRFDPNFCISMENLRVKFVKKDAGGTYQPVDPPEVRLEVF